MVCVGKYCEAVKLSRSTALLFPHEVFSRPCTYFLPKPRRLTFRIPPSSVASRLHHFSPCLFLPGILFTSSHSSPELLIFSSIFSCFLSSLISSGSTWQPSVQVMLLHVNICKAGVTVAHVFRSVFLQNGNADGDKPPCNYQELEDCDDFPDDSSSLTHFDGESLKPTQVVSNTPLRWATPFSICVDPFRPLFCLQAGSLVPCPYRNQPAFVIATWAEWSIKAQETRNMQSWFIPITSLQLWIIMQHSQRGSVK